MNVTLILGLIDGILMLLDRLPVLIGLVKQSSELTPEEEAVLDARIAVLRSRAHWQIDPPPKP
jgi:hypothetical protein